MAICEAETPRLWLRPLVEDDLEDYHAIRSRPEATKWTSRGVPFQTIEESRQWMAGVLPSGSHPHTYAVLLRAPETMLDTGKNGAQMIGIIGVLHDPPEVGYIFNPDFWGRGYANETLKAFLHLYWNGVMDQTLKAFVQDGNNASVDF